MACIDNIVTLGICPDEATSESGFELIKAAGISPKNLANTANETYQSGVELALEKKEIALVRFRNDFIGALQANNVVTTISDPVYDSSIFQTSINNGTYAGYRGVTAHVSSGYKGRLRQTIIKAIQVFPFASGDAVLNINDGYNSYSYAITLVGGSVNTFDEDSLDGFPFIFAPTSKNVRVTIDNTSIAFASTKITCMLGCNKSIPNECAWVDGWDGTRAVKEEGYGINLQFYCHCNYEQVICDLSKSFTGELIWLKWQMEIFQEQLYSNRFTNLVIYNTEQTEAHLKELERQYVNKWNAMMNGIFGILQTYKDDCLNCRGIKRVPNI